MVVVAAFITALVEPVFFAFKSIPGWFPYNDWAALTEYALLLIFTGKV